MIIVQLTGGLGNQMFQYALGRVLSIKHNTGLYVDTSTYDHISQSDIPRSYELNVFGIPTEIASDQNLSKFGKPNKYNVLLNQYFNLGLDPYPKNYIKESDHLFQPEVLNSPDNVYLSGYWQSEKYFIAYRGQIIEDFKSRSADRSSVNTSILKQIKSSNSVSLHVRRSDYVTNPTANVYHGVLDIDYYKKAMKLIDQKIVSPIYFVFSDDPEWVKKNIKSQFPMVYVSHNLGKDAHEDLRFMSLCKHNIIANSSFSWWGAWLNQNPDKIVIAPKKWFNDKSINYKDLIPQGWIGT